ncbi:MAG: UDP-N-acetylmuramoyl-tripeptide--D-alanyl-D-alanine ligase [Polaribacter sp.]|nr:MAG: UDP-N-acetylmuramoyl-tripeptide--D-alanyl-D-alanine ligase [Polaribacter sp.]
MKIEELYKLYKKGAFIDTDTRKIRENSIFFALKGSNFNGNKFAEDALKNGALFSVVDEKQYATNENIILVNNVLETLQKLANYHRNQLGLKIISLTGSNGKTTTKELIYSILSKKYKVVATEGNLNNHIGVPLTLLSIKTNTEIAVVEMGANHHKEIEFLTSLVEPNFGYITNFGKAHLEGFGSVEGVIKAKSELYDYLIKNNKTIFVNPNDAVQAEKTKKANRVLFDPSIDFVEVNPFVKLKYNGLEIQSHLIGKYNFTNISVAVTIGKYFGVPDDDIKNAIETYVPTNNRSQIIEKGTNKIILDAYNANPTSMALALENFSLIKAENKLVILGDMFELGKESLQEHQKIVELIKQFNFDKVCLVGENFYQTKSDFNTFKTYDELSFYLKQNPVENTYILIKGSRGMALERCLSIFTLCPLCDERPTCQ